MKQSALGVMSLGIACLLYGSAATQARNPAETAVTGVVEALPGGGWATRPSG